MHRMADLPRVFFDGNDGSDETGWELHFDTSEADVARSPGGPRNGLLVRLYSPGELEWDAVLRFERERGMWVGMRCGPITVLDVTASG